MHPRDPRFGEHPFKDSLLPAGFPTGTPEDALETASGLYLNEPATKT
ncbi:hypothetical protein ACQP2U_22655 [Nocardia sp. CA-084685]